MKLECSIVYSIQSNFISHVMDLNMWVGNKVLISDWDEEGIYSLVLSLYYCLCKDQCLICMDSSIRYPVFLGLYCWRVNYELFPGLVICCCCLHHHCIISISEFCQAETTCYLKTINLFENVFMSLCV